MARTPLVAGNWKMNGDGALVEAMARACRSAGAFPCEVVICPPAVWLPALVQAFQGLPAAPGAQNVSAYVSGAYTGEVSAGMLAAVGAHYVIVGHSERRSGFGETDAVVVDKTLRVLEVGLIPIVCVGETLAERESGRMRQVVGDQVAALLAGLDEALLQRIVLAYEPVWAIGTGVTATPAQAAEVHAYIRERLRERSSSLAESVRVLYGGSVKAANAAELFRCPDIDGGLIGGASLSPDEFFSICRSATTQG